jgi:hypothetical protein
MHFRFFSASMGRFQKPDSVFGSPLNPQGWNLYSYVQGNPVNFNDPTGHAAMNTEQQLSSMGGPPISEIPPGEGWAEWNQRRDSLERRMMAMGLLPYEPTLDEYLWGGAHVYETVRHWTLTDSNGNVLDWAYQAPGQVAPSFATGKGAEYWLQTVVGVPKDKVAGVLKQLHDVYKRVGMGPELAVVIGLDANGNYKVFSTSARGDNGATRSTDIDKAAKLAGDAGYATIVAAGHAHPFTGCNATITGGLPQKEGASRADASGYGQDVHSWGVANPGALFVLTTGTIFSFNSPPIPNPKDPNDPFTFSRYSW